MADETDDTTDEKIESSARDAVATGLDAAIEAESKLGEGIPANDEQPEGTETEEKVVEETPEEKTAREATEAAAAEEKKGEPANEETPTEKAEREKAEALEANKPKPLSDEKGVITMPKNLRPHQEANWRRLETKASTAETKLAEVSPLAEKVPALEAEVERLKSNPELPDTVRATVEEAEKIRAMFFLTQSEEFQQKYDGRIEKIESGVYDIFKKYKMPDATIQQIKDLGGPIKLDEKWLNEQVLSKVGVVEGERIKKALVDILDLQAAKGEELSQAETNSKKYLEEREQADKTAFETDQGVIKTEIGQAIAALPWAQEKTVPAGASEADKKAIEAHNTEVAKFNAHIQSYLYPKTSQIRAQVAIAAAMSLKLASDMGALVQDRDVNVKKVKELEGQLAALKSRGTVPATKNKTPVKKIDAPAPSVNESSQDAISRGLDAELEG